MFPDNDSLSDFVVDITSYVQKLLLDLVLPLNEFLHPEIILDPLYRLSRSPVNYEVDNKLITAINYYIRDQNTRGYQ